MLSAPGVIANQNYYTVNFTSINVSSNSGKQHNLNQLIIDRLPMIRNAIAVTVNNSLLCPPDCRDATRQSDIRFQCQDMIQSDARLLQSISL